MQKQLVTVVIPCHNEAKSIKKVVKDFHNCELTNNSFDFDILVVDNNSSDNTAEVALKAGARVICETKKGKGNAMRTGFDNIAPEAKYVVMLDGDDTYRPEEVLRLLEPLHHKFCDVVVGSRLSGKIHGDSMDNLNRAGNWGFTHLARFFYKLNVTDVLSGYFAWEREAIDKLSPQLRSPGFAIEMEMLTKMARMGLEVYSVPISYYQRAGESNLRPFYDGYRILSMLAKNLKWSPREAAANEEVKVPAEA
jgi:dolichol-phosphate hexosyltransferase